MMIDPLSVYLELKDKPKEEILESIRDYRDTVSILKYSPMSIVSPYVIPGADVRLTCNKEYLKAAIKAYEEAGGKYRPRSAAEKDAVFQRRIQHISSVEYAINSMPGMHTPYLITFDGEKVICQLSSFDSTSSPVLLTGKNGEPVTTRSQFLELISSLHLGKWRRNYFPRHSILDGWGWSLTVQYGNGLPPEEFGGCNSCPRNFDDLDYIFRSGYELDSDD